MHIYTILCNIDILKYTLWNIYYKIQLTLSYNMPLKEPCNLMWIKEKNQYLPLSINIILSHLSQLRKSCNIINIRQFKLQF